MTDRELRKLNRKELLALVQKQEEDCEQAKEHIGQLRQENREGRDRLEEQVHEIAEKFVRLKNLLLEKEEKLKAAEAKLADQERTIRSMQERQSAGPRSFRT